MRTCCSVPSKLILSGEHAVLYGCPALSMAIDLETRCTLMDDEASVDLPGFTVSLKNFDLKQHFSFAEWQHQAEKIDQRFEDFRSGTAPINAVLTSPFDLILITLSNLCQIRPFCPANWQIEIESNAPIGRGLGSSAAVIVSLIKTMLTQLHWQMDDKELLELAKRIEAYQHGHSSGIDPATLLHGGLLKYQLHQKPQPLANRPFNAWLIDTGKPQSTTGECVTWVKQHHQNDKNLWQSFSITTHQIEQAWSNWDQNILKQAIDRNHQLLCRIGVVPNRIQSFIETLRGNLNASCKICGAGSIAGESAGMLLCISENSPADLCRANGYHFRPLKIQSQGVQCELA
ncbi:mevalonate kinase [Thiomicrorhabdus sp.]|uniref:mevalonate kinase family protein n=1 Tax=Thiomicrorhabdus sp. TaxID=2039724 RepID=UPI003563A44D